MDRRKLLSISILFLILFLAACSPAPQIPIQYDPVALKFDGHHAFALESDFVTRFPNRASGMPNNKLAAAWLRDQFTHSGWTCSIDEWTVINYSKTVPMNNVVCTLPGASTREIVVVAHLDQSPRTVQGADNDGSGISILLHLGKVFAAEKQLPYTLVFVATDGEEYGMLGTLRFIRIHLDTSNIIAGFSLDNLGNSFYIAMDMDGRGQFRGAGQLWLQLLARDSARKAGNLWPVKIRGVMDQVTDQAVPLSFMDEGPMVTAGIPALGFAGIASPEFRSLYWNIYHSPEDTLDRQSPEVLQQSGRVQEATIRQLMTMATFPDEPGPYLYFESSSWVLRGGLLWGIFTLLVVPFFLGSLLAGGTSLKNKVGQWRNVLPHFLGLWLPLGAAIALLYFLVAVGLMEKFALYPATTKDPETLNPHWLAVIIFLLGLAIFLWLGRWLTHRFAGGVTLPTPGAVRSFALFVVGLASVYILVVNPFSLLFCLPLYFWLLIRVRKGPWHLLDILFLILGGAVVYYLLYVMGFQVLHMGFAVLWYLMLMFSIRMIGIPAVLAITAILAAGLTMVVNLPLTMAPPSKG